jgi:hypothetical protein
VSLCAFFLGDRKEGAQSKQRDGPLGGATETMVSTAEEVGYGTGQMGTLRGTHVATLVAGVRGFSRVYGAPHQQHSMAYLKLRYSIMREHCIPY